MNDDTVAVNDGWIFLISGTEPTDVFNSHGNYSPTYFTEYFNEEMKTKLKCIFYTFTRPTETEVETCIPVQYIGYN